MIPRHLHRPIERALRRFPVVLLSGARQVGKSTLARALAEGDWRARYITLDDRASLDAALLDPDGFLASMPTPVVIDEIQRAPDLLRAIKKVVDERRRPGRYLLTGSANVLTLPTVAERLAGRVVLFNLEPLSWAERARREPSPAIARLMKCADAPSALRLPGFGRAPNRRPEIQELVLSGGYPPAALSRSAEARRQWFAGYQATYLERDIREIAAIEHVPEFHRLLGLLTLRTGQLLNFSEVARDSGLAMMTLRRYVALLETTFQTFLVQPYFTSRLKRLVKTPKLYLTDTGLAAFLSAADSWAVLERQGRSGALVETWVACELRRLLSAIPERIDMFFFRSHDDYEVDFVLEGPGSRLLPIEVKMGSRIDARDLVGLRKMRDALSDRMAVGVVAYGGTEVVGIDRYTIAIPFGVLFGPDAPTGLQRRRKQARRAPSPRG
jgi:predicted AAA+ superfamily ATPase